MAVRVGVRVVWNTCLHERELTVVHAGCETGAFINIGDLCWNFLEGLPSVEKLLVFHAHADLDAPFV